MDIHALPDPLRSLVTGEIAPGERVLWAEQPAPRPRFPWIMIFPVLFGIPWTLFSLFWIAAAAGVLDPLLGIKGVAAPGFAGGRVLFSLFGIPFVLIGVGLITSPYWMRRRIRRAAERTAYVITDRRAIVFDGGYYGDGGLAALAGGMIRLTGKGTSIRSYMPDQIRHIERIEHADGSGHLLFGEILFTTQGQHGSRESTRSGFFSVPFVRRAEELMRALAQP